LALAQYGMMHNLNDYHHKPMLAQFSSTAWPLAVYIIIIVITIITAITI
jgi:hypothetical protein